MVGLICTLRIDYNSSEEAEAVARSLEPDNQGYIETEVRGSSLLCFARAEDPLSLLHTLDDFLACLTVAEETLSGK